MDTTTTILLILLTAALTWAIAFHLGQRSQRPAIQVRQDIIDSYAANLRMMRRDQAEAIQQVHDLRAEFTR